MRHVQSLITRLGFAALATGCGGGAESDGGPTAPPSPATVTLILDFHHIEVQEDCDGIEGDGDFAFRVKTDRFPPEAVDVVYDKSVSLGPGGKSEPLGRRSYTLSATERGERVVEFGASEKDRNAFGTVYNDARLNFESGMLTHLYNNGTWNTLGDHSITLGSAGCRVTLSWTASANAS